MPLPHERFSALARVLILSLALTGGAGAILSQAGCTEPVTEEAAATYTCPMHDEVHSDDPDGECPICGMDLVPREDDSATDHDHDGGA